MSSGNRYEINIFDIKSIEKLENAFKDLEEALNSEDFMRFLADKCMVELNSIIDKSLRTEEYETDYRDNNNYETSKEQVRIYNDSMVDLSNVSPETLLNYPNGLSLAKLIEFGTGIYGTPNKDFDWDTQVNTSRDYEKGWVYERDGQLHWTKGQSGHFIYQQLRDSVEQHITNWVLEYAKTNLKGGK